MKQNLGRESSRFTVRGAGENKTAKLNKLSWQKKLVHISQDGMKGYYLDAKGRRRKASKFEPSELQFFFKTFQKMEEQNPGSLDDISYAEFRDVVFKYYRENRRIFSPVMMKMVSGVTSSTGTQRRRADPAIHFRRDVARNIDPETADREATGIELLSHPASVQNRGERVDRSTSARLKMARAMADEHDPSVQIGNKMYYLFARPTPKKKPKISTSSSGKQKYEVVVPPEFDIMAKGFLDIGNLDFTKMDVSRDLRPNWKAGGSLRTIHTAWAKNFSEFVIQMQEKAWKQFKAKKAYKMQKELIEYYKTVDKIRRLANMAERSNDVKAKSELKREYEELKALLSEYLAFEAEGQNKAELAKAWTWYLWLIAAENAYGVWIPKRRKHRPTLAQTADAPPREAKVGKEGETPIRIARQPGGPKLAPEIFHGVGFAAHTVPEMEMAFRRVKKKPEVTWIPVVGSLRKLGINPAKLRSGEYLRLSRAQNRLHNPAKNVGGNISYSFDVKNSMPGVPMYGFRLKKGAYLFGLMRADKYLQYFDSPSHEGKRLIQGKDELASGSKTFTTQRDLAQHVRPTDAVSPGEQEKLQQQTANSVEAQRKVDAATKKAATALKARIKRAKARDFEKKRKERAGQHAALQDMYRRGIRGGYGATASRDFYRGRAEFLQAKKKRTKKKKVSSRGFRDKDAALGRNPNWVSVRDEREAAMRPHWKPETKESAQETPYTRWRTRWHSLMEVRGGI